MLISVKCCIEQIWNKKAKDYMAKFKHIPTKKLKEILDSNHCTGIDGKDYEPVKEYLQDVLWRRESETDIDKLVADYYEKLA